MLCGIWTFVCVASSANWLNNNFYLHTTETLPPIFSGFIQSADMVACGYWLDFIFLLKDIHSSIIIHSHCAQQKSHRIMRRLFENH
jgi:hypothetical protein